MGTGLNRVQFTYRGDDKGWHPLQLGTEPPTPGDLDRPAPPTGRGQHPGRDRKEVNDCSVFPRLTPRARYGWNSQGRGRCLPSGSLSPLPLCRLFSGTILLQSSKGLLPTVPGKTAHPSFLDLLHHWLPCPQVPGCSSPETTPSPFTAPLISPSFPARGTPQCSVLGTLHFFFHDGLPQ